MKTRTFRAPVTVLYNGRYVPRGTEITLPEDEAKSLTDRFGECDEGETNSLKDLESVATLNLMKALHGG